MNHTQGFTLLEMLMAMVLSAMLMIGVMAVIADLGANSIDHSPAGGGASGNDATVESLARLVGEDMEQAEKMDATQPNRLMLIGYCGLDDRGRGRMHRQVRVEYRIERVNDRSWLVRRQILRDVLTNQNIQRDLVCADVTGFTVSGGAKVLETGGAIRLRLQIKDQANEVDRMIAVRVGKSI